MRELISPLMSRTSDLYAGVYEDGLIRKITENTIATIPTTPAREKPNAASSTIATSTGAKYRGTHAGAIWEAIHASRSVAKGIAISVHTTVASRVRRWARVNSSPT